MRYPIMAPTGHGGHVECKDKSELLASFLEWYGAHPPCKVVVLYDDSADVVEAWVDRQMTARAVVSS